jgi:hypothetical protein
MTKANNASAAAATETSPVIVKPLGTAVLKLEGAKALISVLSIFIAEAADTDDGLPVTGALLGKAMHGIRLLLDDVSDSMGNGASHA